MQTSLGRFASSGGRNKAVGMTNPLYEASGGGGDIQQPTGIIERENDLYESPDVLREMSEDMDN